MNAIFDPPLTDTAGYFRLSKVKACQTRASFLECHGDRSATYRLGIDPNVSDSPTADDWAMVLVKVPNDTRINPSVVHLYAEHGEPLKRHLDYLRYLLASFDITELYYDGSQGIQMMGSLLEPLVSPTTSLIPLVMNSAIQRALNEHLQAAFDHRRIDLPVACNVAPGVLSAIYSEGHVDDQCQRAQWLIKQVTSIEIRAGSLGNVSWDLPIEVKLIKGKNRPRKDLHSALLLAIAYQIQDGLMHLS